jgi:archaellum component FlaF (FlaF/FlaG flagellin family)
MRKHLIFIILLSCLCLGARGQSEPEIDLSGLPQKTTASSLRYWFDTDADNVQTSNTLNGAATINASALKEGIHTIHYQIVDNKGIAGIPNSKIFILLDQRVVAKSKSLRYWFDTDANSVKTTETLSGATTIDASALKEGVHTVHYQIIDDQGVAGITDSKIFILLDQRVTAKSKSLRYWFDTDASSVKTTETLAGATTIDASALKEGIHTVHYQIIDDQGVAGITDSKIFILLDQRVTAKSKSLRYWFDTDVSSVKTTETLAGATTIDASALKDGIHTLHYQIIDDQENVDIPVSAMFFKLSSKVAIAATAVQYWFDENDDIIKETTLDLNNLTMAINVGGLGQGEHVLHYQLILSDGTLSPAASATFETTQTLRGDANNDQKVNVADIVVIQIFIDDNTKAIHGANADATGDGVVDEKDVETVSDIIMGTE